MKIAIVEDDINMRKSLEIAMSDYKEFEIITFKNAKDALKGINESFHLVITDINMPGMDGIEFVKELDGKFEVIIMTGNATLQRAIESIHLGVKDFLLKPFDVDTLIAAIKREDKIQKVKKIVHAEQKNVNNSGFYGTSKALESALHIASKAAKTDATILLLGQSGVGKEVFASFIHEHSPRSKKPFIAINMAAIPDNLIESELFGFEKGAFTDASEAKAGQFELANGGTLFLDEIAEMPYGVQAKLLRALQEKEVRRLGSSKSIKIDIRVIAATNADLEQKIHNGTFREDLYYRLNTIPIIIAPLAERKEEILAIAQKILEQNCVKYGFELKSFSDESKKQLLAYNWPGNIRELISVVERAVILSDANEIAPEGLFLSSRRFTK
ncbi:response regulator receiver domain protein (CheY-like) [Sulfurimonas denitrificans DSM 1251]|uniref:Response regulator receiver domain protein (CheY-like) n=1 Tax=Sulfurimonas denitrificans (strain ATCC 33889 / DSM 1251) TaxID=326298 RepID=Q30SW5_SULDN|nr:sigma-54 dependent transcriptional regulator [Sulfurimonas denitrificans]ABB43916.1 response regulator receiver domain protein (CheY-like) [Sulfurimonas denitrificans DSM 1251]MDD3442397.1 sigma-54 dependent transcriptional regulator [Sulfurimonas denitrificans]